MLAPPAFAQQVPWDSAPYRVHALLVIDGPDPAPDELGNELAVHLARRVDAAIGPIWQFEVTIAAASIRPGVLAQLDAADAEPPAEPPMPGGKLVLLAVRMTSWGYELSAREYDGYVERWGGTLRRQARQRAALPEQLFALLREVVAPLAQLELDPEDEHRALLAPRGAALPHKSADWFWARPGDVFLPILRRTTRDGELTAGGIQPVPWTYVEVVDAGADILVGRIDSGTRRPLGVRRRGRIEQIAIALRADPGPTTLRFVSRSSADQRLPGYEVYMQSPGDKEPVLAGRSDRQGQITIAAGLESNLAVGEPSVEAPPDGPPSAARPSSPIKTLFIRNGGELLARMPIVPGAAPQIVVPLPDDDARLAAETRLAALREDLVDVVARRNILMARVRQKIAGGEFQAARPLMNALDQLPGRPQFAQRVDRVALQNRAGDPQVQRKIDQLVAGTQAAIGQYLDMRPIRELQEEFRQAERAQSAGGAEQQGD
jgi:hypothetical protein